MAIEIYKEKNALVLHYEFNYPEGNNAKWVIDNLKEDGYCIIAHIFKFKSDDLIEYDTKGYSYVLFKIADLIKIGKKNIIKLNTKFLMLTLIYFLKNHVIFQLIISLQKENYQFSK